LPNEWKVLAFSATLIHETGSGRKKAAKAAPKRRRKKAAKAAPKRRRRKKASK